MALPRTLAARLEGHPTLNQAKVSKAAKCRRQDVSHFFNGRRDRVGRDVRKRIETVLISEGVMIRTPAKEKFRKQYLEFHQKGMRCPPSKDIH